MAVPVTLQAWRAWANRPDPVPPARLSAAARQALPGTAQVAYDAERLAWLSADVVFDTDDVKALTRMVRVATVRNRVDSVLRALLADAATEAILTHTERVTRTLLDATPTDRQADDLRTARDATTLPASVVRRRGPGRAASAGGVSGE